MTPGVWLCEHDADFLAHDRLAEALAAAEHRRLLEAVARPRRSLRVAVGLALLRAGHWLADGSAPARGQAPG